MNSIILALLFTISNPLTLMGSLKTLASEDPFQAAIDIFKDITLNSQFIGKQVYTYLVSCENPVKFISFAKLIQEHILGDIQVSNTANPFFTEVDLNKDGFVDQKEIIVGMRNLITLLAGLQAFDNKPYKPPDELFQKNIQLVVNLVEGYLKTIRQITDHLFDKEDKNKSGTLSTKEFLKAFLFKDNQETLEVLKQFNPEWREVITKDMAYKIFGLIALNTSDDPKGQVLIALQFKNTEEEKRKIQEEKNEAQEEKNEAKGNKKKAEEKKKKAKEEMREADEEKKEADEEKKEVEEEKKKADEEKKEVEEEKKKAKSYKKKIEKKKRAEKMKTAEEKKKTDEGKEKIEDD